MMQTVGQTNEGKVFSYTESLSIVTRPTTMRCSRWQELAKEMGNNDGTFVWLCTHSIDRNHHQQSFPRESWEGNLSFSCVFILFVLTKLNASLAIGY